MASLLVVAFAALLVVWKSGGEDQPNYGPAEASAYRAVKNAQGDADLVELARTYLSKYRESDNAAAVERMLAQAKDRLRRGTSATVSGFDPAALVKDLKPGAAIVELESMLKEAKPEHRPAIRNALEAFHARLGKQRAAFFRDLELVFREHKEKGEFARAREIWFFLRGEPDWVPIPPEYVTKIVAANSRLETAAAAARTRLFELVAQHEAGHDFKAAKQLLAEALPRFAGTSVERSLRERLDFNERALRGGVTGLPAESGTVVRVDTRKRVDAALELLVKRDFAGAAKQLEALAGELGKQPDAAKVAARAAECSAAAILHAAITADLGAGKLPRGQIARKWRVLKGDAAGLTVKAKSGELTYPWSEVPSLLYTALAAKYLEKAPLGYCVLAHAVGGEPSLAEALAAVLEKKQSHKDIDRFIAARVKNEKLPEGGYVLYAKEIVSKKEFHRRREEALIQRFTEQFKKAHAAIMADVTKKKLDKLVAQKDKLDEARTYAKELIYDTKKYFYPYRDTGRMGEYNKVQQEVDARVDAVRELWNKLTPKTVKASNEMKRNLNAVRRGCRGVGEATRIRRGANRGSRLPAFVLRQEVHRPELLPHAGGKGPARLLRRGHGLQHAGRGQHHRGRARAGARHERLPHHVRPPAGAPRREARLELARPLRGDEPARLLRALQPDAGTPHAVRPDEARGLPLRLERELHHGADQPHGRAPGLVPLQRTPPQPAHARLDGDGHRPLRPLHDPELRQRAQVLRERQARTRRRRHRERGRWETGPRGRRRRLRLRRRGLIQCRI